MGDASSSTSLAEGPDGRPRCRWALAAPEYVAYHDDEWGCPVRDDRGLCAVRAAVETARRVPG